MEKAVAQTTTSNNLSYNIKVYSEGKGGSQTIIIQSYWIGQSLNDRVYYANFMKSAFMYIWKYKKYPCYFFY